MKYVIKFKHKDIKNIMTVHDITSETLIHDLKNSLEEFNWFRKKPQLKEIDIEDIHDICLELEDPPPLGLGMEVTIDPMYDHKHRFLVAKNIRDLHYREVEDIELRWRDVKDFVIRLKEYLGNRFVSFDYKESDDDYGEHTHYGANENIIDDNTTIYLIKVTWLK